MKKAILCVIVFSMIVLAGCSDAIPIEEITDAPEKFLYKQCVVEGRITWVIDVPFLQKDLFKINDSTGEIWVYTEKGAPPDDAEVEVRGTFIKFSDIPVIEIAKSILTKINVEIGYCVKLQEIKYL